MILNFYKYQATGNDFIIINNRDLMLKKDDTELIKSLCNRKFGIGADGLILLQNHPVLDFEMLYFNSDGNEGTMCGNGGRCIVAFAKKISPTPGPSPKGRGVFIPGLQNYTKFQAIDGVHEAEIDEFDNTIIKLKMNDVKNIEEGDGYYFLDTGSPNYVNFVEDVNKIDVYNEGRKIRFNKKFGAKGTNVNFVKAHPPTPSQREGEKEVITFVEGLFVRTYERGVENETLSCGTGVVASAICASLKRHTPTLASDNAPPLKREIKPSTYIYEITTKGGNLKVSFDRKEKNIFENIWLEGSAKFVFEGKIEIDY